MADNAIRVELGLLPPPAAEASLDRAHAVIVARPKGRVAILARVSQGAVQGVEFDRGDVMFLCKLLYF